MDLDTYTARLRDDLVAAAALGDESTRDIAATLATATENAARLTLLSALSELATEISETLGDRTVHVSVDGTDARVDVRPNGDSEAATEPTAASTATGATSTEAGSKRTREASDIPTLDDLTGDISRVTLRLVDQLKCRAEQAAAQNGVSLNSWLSSTVQDALGDQMRRG